MNAELIKEKIAKAVDKINSLKAELKDKKEESELLGMEVLELKEENEKLAEVNRVLNEEKIEMSESNVNVVKEIEGKLSELNNLFDDEDDVAADQQEIAVETPISPVVDPMVSEESSTYESEMESLDDLLGEN